MFANDLALNDGFNKLKTILNPDFLVYDKDYHNVPHKTKSAF